ncbi:hypothetical protein GLAREA_10136 [Glarea lozoyensis ATCC 20868]|uniref:Heterokaryon incompatibility domain-containing protein n=1 Tax=Glarea lozoyensis (strain ATCC 20868 / MF5171) TaxID=1116229 RepID=S3D7G8_GLAL2|nr:uncharacterized protein GLAREA_10136 [Glarea lozoyensis ATCC 20868]EPE34442.1 hypothetical protein GLAREA_10136 [Glarea lozoyensis ATCC 20868]
MHSSSLASFTESGNGGCRICYMLYRHFCSDSEYQAADELIVTYRITPAFDIFGSRSANIEFKYTNLVGGYARKTFELLDVDELLSKGIISNKLTLLDECEQVSITTISTQQRLKQAWTWLDNCSATHGSCNARLSDNVWRPSRLIKIPDDIVGLKLQLVETAGSRSLGPYLTLSHCWGNADFFRLTTHNIEELKAGFSVDVLPRTFQDAMVVAKGLQCEYIWIDSLCIIQNSTEDWTREAKLMSKVYQGAMCNIAATWASDSSMGLFPGHCLEPRPCMIEIKEYGTRTGMFHIWDRNHWLNAIELAPLLKRAWVVQERLLATRVLHFAKGELFWECNQERLCETYPRKMPDLGTIVSEALIRPDGNWLSMSEREEMWRSIIGTYSGAQLTKLEDKEAAHIRSTPVEHSATWFPTWSWLSINCKVETFKRPREAEFPEQLQELYAVDLEDLSLERAGPSPISPIVKRFIRLRGILTQVVWEDVDLYHGQVRLDLSVHPGHVTEGPREIYGRLDYIRTPSMHGRSYCCVVIACYGIRTKKFCGLVLELVREGVYKRVGNWNSYDPVVKTLISKRRRGQLGSYIADASRELATSYKKYPFEVHYSEDGCTTNISRKASPRELQEREDDTEEVVFTII